MAKQDLGVAKVREEPESGGREVIAVVEQAAVEDVLVREMMEGVLEAAGVAVNHLETDFLKQRNERIVEAAKDVVVAGRLRDQYAVGEGLLELAREETADLGFYL